MEIKDIRQSLIKHYESTSEIERFINKLFVERNCAIGLQRNAEHERNQLREELKSAYTEIELLKENCKNLDLFKRNVDYSKMTLNGYSLADIEELKASQPIKCFECTHFHKRKPINLCSVLGLTCRENDYCSFAKRKEKIEIDNEV